MGLIPSEFLLDENGTSSIGERISPWVKKQGSAKEVARLFEVSPKTVESWRGGNPPQIAHLEKMVALWGEAFLLHIFAPVLDETDLSMLRRLERVKSQITLIEAWASEFGNAKTEMDGLSRDGFVAHRDGGNSQQQGTQLDVLGKKSTSRRRRIDVGDCHGGADFNGGCDGHGQHAQRRADPHHPQLSIKPLHPGVS